MKKARKLTAVLLVMCILCSISIIGFSAESASAVKLHGPSSSGCGCACHHTPGMIHVTACCFGGGMFSLSTNLVASF